MSQVKTILSSSESDSERDVALELLKDMNEMVDKKTTIDDLYEIQTKFPPAISYLPHANKIYDINLNTREINSPEFLSVQRDHKSEVIYFRVSRYFDHMDLSSTIAVIEYMTPEDKEGVPHLYVVPFFDITSDFKLEDIEVISSDKNVIQGRWNPTMIFPWCVSGIATKNAGTIRYAIRFYKIAENDEGKQEIVYDLHTLPAQSKILYSLEVNDELMKTEYDTPIASNYVDLINQIQGARTYWTIVEE